MKLIRKLIQEILRETSYGHVTISAPGASSASTGGGNWGYRRREARKTRLRSSDESTTEKQALDEEELEDCEK